MDDRQDDFNSSQFFLHVADIPHDAFQVLDFYCLNDGISQDYTFQIECISQTQHDISHWFLKRAKIFNRHGLITHIMAHNKFHEGYLYEITLSSPLYLFKTRKTERIFLNKTVNDIIDQVFETAGWHKSQWHWQSKEPLPRVDYLVQHQQTDFDLIMGLVEKYQLNFVFEDYLKLNNDLSLLNKQPISVDKLVSTEKRTCYEVNQPSTLFVSTDNRTLNPGQLVDVDDKTYRVANIHHQVSQNAKEKDSKLRYQANVTLIDPSLPQHPNYLFKRLQSPPLFTAKTEAIEKQYADINEDGYYYIRFPFDKISKETMGSPPIALVEPHYMHFPLRENTEVVVRFLEGDISKPILIGTLPNADNPTPVTDKNNSQYLHRTHGGHELLMDDKEGESKIRLSNPNQANTILLDATKDNPQINVQSVQGSINVKSGNNTNMYSKDSHTQEVGQSQHITTENSQSVTSEDNIELQSGANTALSAKRDIYLKTHEKDIQFKSKSSQMTAQNIHLQSESAIQLKGHKKLNIYAKKGVSLSGSEGFHLVASGSSISGSDSCLILNTPKLMVNAQSIMCPMPTPGGSVSVPPAIHELKIPSDEKKEHKNDHDYNIFVATVYGEAVSSTYLDKEKKYYADDVVAGRVPSDVLAGRYQHPVVSSVAAWKSVGSVIMNRAVGGKTPVEVVSNGQFDAYGKTNFTNALSALDSGHPQRLPDLERMYEELKPVYYQRETTTTAYFYYSPITGKLLHQLPQEWQKKDKYVKPEGLLKTDDFAFYDK